MTQRAEFLVLLTRIAEGLERCASVLAVDPHRTARLEAEAEQRKVMRFRLAIEADTRFPGLIAKVDQAVYMGAHLRDALIEAHDGVAIVHYLMNDRALLNKIAVAEPEDVKTELARVAQRLSLKAVH